MNYFSKDTLDFLSDNFPLIFITEVGERDILITENAHNGLMELVQNTHSWEIGSSRLGHLLVCGLRE